MMHKIPIVIIGACLLCSCAFHSGVMTADLPTDFNQEIKKRAKGKAATVHVLGIGGLDHKHLVADAKKNMYSNYPLKDGEAYANLVVDYRFFPYLLVLVREVYVTADVVEDPKIQSDSLQAYFEPPLNEKGLRILSKDGIWVKANDEVLVKKGNETDRARVEKVLGKKKVICFSSLFGQKKYGLRQFFFIDKNLRFDGVDYHVGQSVPLKKDGSFVFCEIIGLNPKFVLLKRGNEISVSHFKDISQPLPEEISKGDVTQP
jgi:hypothetical protein